ncbi:MAG: hypothetical protein NZT92_06380 [Abditibacteriales bacterium]|nr:hypothetical protein [Abditibacteriales bacterium]MDW8367772.1 hypothetical protein [Abditibacteriales bacterium]
MQELEIGGVKFRVEYRHFGGDRGPAVRVYGDVDGREVELLRFDCFEKDPHYHYDPGDKDHRWNLDPLTMGDPTAFSLAQIETRLKDMIAKAGYEAVAARVDQCAVASNISQIKAAIEAAKAAV